MRIRCLYLLFAVTTLACKEDDCFRPRRCNLEPQPDVCQAAIPRFYYDKEEKRCKEYSWGGCADFPFETLEECKQCECKK